MDSRQPEDSFTHEKTRVSIIEKIKTKMGINENNKATRLRPLRLYH